MAVSVDARSQDFVGGDLETRVFGGVCDRDEFDVVVFSDD
jgi:hypothetical protein